ncbi:hypothetical protein Y032_0001g388 [Ancylostoma ceylanicum]|uniref:Uncharacterized protein n=1 Tax=Ancylostoma ceylanicum TaxID=53326 RepID=A0A016W5T9_9BILA|nr:hypothetical protein Y032_0001g388 [Ancylostoma ceylanicum]
MRASRLARRVSNSLYSLRDTHSESTEEETDVVTDECPVEGTDDLIPKWKEISCALVPLSGMKTDKGVENHVMLLLV